MSGKAIAILAGRPLRSASGSFVNVENIQSSSVFRKTFQFLRLRFGPVRGYDLWTPRNKGRSPPGDGGGGGKVVPAREAKPRSRKVEINFRSDDFIKKAAEDVEGMSFKCKGKRFRTRSDKSSPFGVRLNI